MIDPANISELVNIAQEVGAEVLQGALRHPSDTGGWQLGHVDLGEHLEQYRGQQVVMLLIPAGRAAEEEPEPVLCGVCGFVVDEAGDCPRCKMMVEDVAAGLARRRIEQELMQEIEEHLAGLEGDHTRTVQRAVGGLAQPRRAFPDALQHPCYGHEIPHPDGFGEMYLMWYTSC